MAKKDIPRNGPNTNDDSNLLLMGNLARTGLTRRFNGDDTGDSYILIPKKASKSPKRDWSTSAIKFGQDPNEGAYVKLHLGITKETYQSLKHDQERFEPLPTGFEVLERRIADPETQAKNFLERLQRGGKPFGWDARIKYQEEHFDALVEHISIDPESRLFDFMSNGEHVGFCKLSGIFTNWKPRDFERGLNKHEAVMAFSKQEDMQTFPTPIEVDKFAIFPEHMGKGHGSVALPQMMRLIFEELKKDYDTIYLDTRSTNPIGTEEYYATLGVRGFACEVLQNDLFREIEWPPQYGSNIRKTAKGFAKEKAVEIEAPPAEAANGAGDEPIEAKGGATATLGGNGGITQDNITVVDCTSHEPIIGKGSHGGGGTGGGKLSISASFDPFDPFDPSNDEGFDDDIFPHFGKGGPVI